MISLSKNLYKKINKKIIVLKTLYKFFISLSILIFIYIIIDMYSKSQTRISFMRNDSTDKRDRLIHNPRMQLEPNKDDFHYIIADKGIWNIDKDEVDLYNVKADSTLGTITSNFVKVKDKNTLLEFRGNPVFTLYFEKQDNNNKENLNDTAK